MTAQAPAATVHGFPRIGARRQLKTAVERFWAGQAGAAELGGAGARIRQGAWATMAAAGIDLVPCNDFSFYDHVLDAAVLVGAVPARFRDVNADPLDTYFAMARGRPGRAGQGGTAPMAMTKWFDTNYHFIVPELEPGSEFRLGSSKPFDELAEARRVGAAVKPVLLGPVSFLLLSRAAPGTSGFEPLALLDRLLPVYEEALARLAGGGAAWVQMDEPAFVADRSPAELAALERAYARLGGSSRRPPIVVSTYFGHPGDALAALGRTPIEGVGLDLVAGPRGLAELAAGPAWRDRTVFAGVVDGRNVWANDLDRSLELLDRVAELAGRVVVSSSCSFLHVPVGLAGEEHLEPGLRARLAFATEKLAEVGLLARALEHGPASVADELAERRRPAPTGAGQEVRTLTRPEPGEGWARAPLPRRRAVQQELLGLPVLPTTTIGSFPQTPELRAARAGLASGRLSAAEYEARMRAEIGAVVHLQERAGVDVVVHGEPERADMVQYFAERLDGFTVTDGGWVQSYGTRCVRPPIIHSEVRRRAPMTLRWWRFAASLTARPVKAMLTGPVTMVLWSFPREDQPAANTARQVGLALREEVADLEGAGAVVVQVDEPAFREGLPLRAEDRPGYLSWAVEAFRLATGGAADTTQVHTHMCYSEFAEILDAVAALDADVVSFEAARSSMELLAQLAGSPLGAEVGPGVYDVHSPRVPSTAELAELMERAAEAVGPERLWVNPDCGLKTRSYAEVEPALAHMVAAAREVRARLGRPG